MPAHHNTTRLTGWTGRPTEPGPVERIRADVPAEVVELRDMFDRCAEDVTFALAVEPHLAHVRDGELHALRALTDLSDGLRAWIVERLPRDQASSPPRTPLRSPGSSTAR